MQKGASLAVYENVLWNCSLFACTIVNAECIRRHSLGLRLVVINTATKCSIQTLLCLALCAGANAATMPNVTAEPAARRLITNSGASTHAPAVVSTPARPVLQGHIVRPGSVYNATKGIFDFSDKLAQPQAQPQQASSALNKATAAGKSLANFLLDLRGFDWSKEGADLVLDEHLNTKNESARDFLSRRQLDARELAMISSILKLADSLQAGAHSAKEQSEALRGIELTIGECEAINLYCRLAEANAGSTLPIAWSGAWDLSQRELKSQTIFETALQKDPVVQDLKDRLHRFNNHSKLLQLSAKTIYSTMGIASFAPTCVAPIAEVSLLSFMMATGGPEQDKLLKELYLSKALENRYRLLAEKTNLITACHTRAVYTQNATLMACSRELLRQMTDEQFSALVFSESGAEETTP
jgi:hypothetical protein